MVYAKGSTPARTRLDQMGIVVNWEQIQPLLEVYGFVGEVGKGSRKTLTMRLS